MAMNCRQISTSNDSQFEEKKAKGKRRKNDKMKHRQVITLVKINPKRKHLRRKKERATKRMKLPQLVPLTKIDLKRRKPRRKEKAIKRMRHSHTESPRVLGDSGTDHSMKPRETETNHITWTLSGGLVIEELDIGNPDGKVATSGKKASQINFCRICSFYGKK